MKLAIKPAEWTDARAALLQPGAPDNLADIQRQVETGESKLFVVEDEAGSEIVAFVLRVEQMVEKAEGVIVAAAGEGNGINLTRTVLPHMEKLFIGCDTCRIHTARPGLAKVLVKEHGYRLQELVLVKELKNG